MKTKYLKRLAGMAETGGAKPERESTEQDVLGVLIESFEMRMIKNHPLFAAAQNAAAELRQRRFESEEEAEAASREAVDELDQLAYNNKFLHKKVTIISPDIWVQIPERVSEDSPDFIVRTVLLGEDDSALAGVIADKGSFYGFVRWAVKIEDEPGMWRPALAIHTIRGGTGSPFIGPYFYSVAEIMPDTEIHFEDDESLLETKNVLMMLSGKDENGKDKYEALVNKNTLMNLATLLNSSVTNAYNADVFVKIVNIVRNITADIKDGKNKFDIERGLEKLLMLSLHLGPGKVFCISCDKVIDKQLSEQGGDMELRMNMQTTDGKTDITGTILGIDFMPILTEGEGYIMTSPETFPHFVIEESVDSNGKLIPESKRRLRYIPMQSITDFVLKK